MTTGPIFTSRKLSLALALCFALWLGRSWAQTTAPPAAKPGGPVRTFHYKDTTNGSVVDAIFDGNNAISLPGGRVLLHDFKVTRVRDGQASNVTVTATAPECQIASNYSILSDPGPIQIFTPTTNLYVQALGFFVAQSNQVLFLSNQVETRILKSLLQSSSLFAPKSNAPSDASQLVKILSERGQCNFPSNEVDYAGQVRVIDPQYQLESPLLSIQFTSNQTVETMFARQDVTLTLTGKGVATGATAHYFATNYFGTNENELLELAGDAKADAHWQNGEQQASAAKFTYDPNRHLLTGDDRVRVRWPNRPAGDSSPTTFRALSADHATLLMNTNGGAMEAMTAWGHLIITNEADQSSATAGKAVYDGPHDLLTLTEDPVWWNDHMKVRGDLLSTELSNQVYRAQGRAGVRLHMAGASGSPGGSTNQWLTVSCDEIVSQTNAQTNLVTFRGNVLARLLDGEELQDTLTSKVLLVYQASGSGYSNQVVLVVARDDVHAEAVPDAKGVTKTISCDALTAHRSPVTGFWQTIVAEEHAVLESFGSGSAAVSNKVTAAIVTAYFSAVTNQLERAVAEREVNFSQTAPGNYINATGGRGVYTVAPEEQVELTGHPWAETGKLTIFEADRLKYEVKSNAVDAFGLFHIQFKSTATNAASSAQPPPKA